MIPLNRQTKNPRRPTHAHSQTYPAHSPPDDLTRTLTSANPDTKLPQIGRVGDTYTINLEVDDTNGRFCVVDRHIPPGGGPSLHRHDFEETFIVLTGEIEATFRGHKTVVPAWPPPPKTPPT